jgi:hypothetical protein
MEVRSVIESAQNNMYVAELRSSMIMRRAARVEASQWLSREEFESSGRSSTADPAPQTKRGESIPSIKRSDDSRLLSIYA